MKSFKEFLLETQSVTDIEQLSDICRKIIKYLSTKIGAPFGLFQQAVYVKTEPKPCICFNSYVVLNGLPEDDVFLHKEAKNTFLKLAAEYGIDTCIITEEPNEETF